MVFLFKVVSSLHSYFSRAWSRLLMYAYKAQFKSVGNNVVFDPVKSSFSYKSITLGANVFIGPGAIFSADRSIISIGSFVMFGPNVTISGGDHEISSLAMPMYLVKDKSDACDADVIVHDDVWIGANSVILKSVIIGTGSIIAAGSVVTKDVEPFSIYAGVPAKKIKERFSVEDREKYINNMKAYGLLVVESEVDD